MIREEGLEMTDWRANTKVFYCRWLIGGLFVLSGVFSLLVRPDRYVDRFAPAS
jgi:hypothetical protein